MRLRAQNLRAMLVHGVIFRQGRSMMDWSSDFDGQMERARAAGQAVLLDFSAAPM